MIITCVMKRDDDHNLRICNVLKVSAGKVSLYPPHKGVISKSLQKTLERMASRNGWSTSRLQTISKLLNNKTIPEKGKLRHRGRNARDVSFAGKPTHDTNTSNVAKSREDQDQNAASGILDGGPVDGCQNRETVVAFDERQHIDMQNSSMDSMQNSSVDAKLPHKSSRRRSSWDGRIALGVDGHAGRAQRLYMHSLSLRHSTTLPRDSHLRRQARVSRSVPLETINRRYGIKIEEACDELPASWQEYRAGIESSSGKEGGSLNF